jgi:4-hydroxybenzoate polyprenyltransferase
MFQLIVGIALFPLALITGIYIMMVIVVLPFYIAKCLLEFIYDYFYDRKMKRQKARP